MCCALIPLPDSSYILQILHVSKKRKKNFERPKAFCVAKIEKSKPIVAAHNILAMYCLVNRIIINDEYESF